MNAAGGPDEKTDEASSAGPTMRPIRFGESFKAVFWSFFGVRKRRDLERDGARLNPIHVVIAAFLMMGIFIGLLITVVHFVTAK
jgi:hypothetical protein